MIQGTDEKMENCSICLDNMCISDNIKLDCLHLFCDKCINKWKEKNNNCPVCRKEIDKKIIYSIYENIYPDQYQPSGVTNLIHPNNENIYPEQYQPSGVTNLIHPNNENIYSFALHPEEFQPRGHVDFNRIYNSGEIRFILPLNNSSMSFSFL
jgi:hypothetical protein